MMIDPDKVYAKLVEAGEDWSDKDAAANLLEESKHSVLAELMNQSGADSNAAKETIARADPVYRLHITNMVEARRMANRAKVRYAAFQTLADLRRSQESTRRAEMSIR